MTARRASEVLVLGGYIALWQRWAEFSVAWQRLLDEAGWDEFKMARAASRPERAQRFAAVVKEHVAAYLACVLEIGALRQLCTELDLPDFCRNPYNFAIKAILGATYMELGRVGLRWPLEFIFDERGEKKHLRDAWDCFVLGMPDDARRLIAREPKFESSKDVLREARFGQGLRTRNLRVQTVLAAWLPTWRRARASVKKSSSNMSYGAPRQGLCLTLLGKFLNHSPRGQEPCSVSCRPELWAREHGITVQYVWQIVSGLKPPSDTVAKALGLRPDGMRWVRE